MNIAISKNGVPIRLTDERWLHITEGHQEIAGYYYEMLEAVQEPDSIYRGKAKELLAVKEIEKGKHLVVVYKETNKSDGFIITAFVTTKIKKIERRTKVWPQ